jgi:FkbM family methyltransferase
MSAATFEFRPGTCDENVYRSVVELNEYRLPEKLDRHDIIIDVGAHIGSFTRACMDRGAGRIFAFEPNTMNCRQFEKNIFGNYPGYFGISLYPFAVWRSDTNRSVLYHTGYPEQDGEVNTGGGDVMAAPEAGALVPTRSLDMVLRDWVGGVRVRLLKLDCEYSEWPILLTSRELYRVDEICGEYHECAFENVPEHARVLGVEDFTIDVLAEFLMGQGFVFEHLRHGESNLGLFWARRV